MIDLLFALFGVLLVIAYFASPFVFIPPGCRLIMHNRWHRLDILVLDSGFYIVNPLSWVVHQGPFAKLIPGSHFSPAPGSHVAVDPPKCEIRSQDGVFGTSDISIWAIVLPWTGADIAQHHIPFKTTVNLVINQWMTGTLAQVKAADLATHAHVTKLLNEPAALERLNKELAGSFIQATRIAIDPNGIKLDPGFVDSLKREVDLGRKLQLQQLEADTLIQQTRQAMNLELLRGDAAKAAAELQASLARIADKAKAEAAVLQAQNQMTLESMQGEHLKVQGELKASLERLADKTKAEALAVKVTSLQAAGLSSGEITNLLCAEMTTSALKGAQKVFVLPSGKSTTHLLDEPLSSTFVRV